MAVTTSVGQKEPDFRILFEEIGYRAIVTYNLQRAPKHAWEECPDVYPLDLERCLRMQDQSRHSC